MTAFGRALKKTPLGVFSVEIQSVNRKHLELNANLPTSFARFEPDVRRIIASCVFRGNVTVKMAVVFENELPVAVRPNIALLKQYKIAWDTLSQELAIPFHPEAFFNMLSSESGLFLVEDKTDRDSEFLDEIRQVLGEALQHFLKMKEEEGKVLEEDILSRWKKLKLLIAEIGKKTPDAVARYRQKLTERLKDLMTGDSGLDERVLKEIAIYAEKVDISEEITRFESHLKQFYDLVQTSSESVGKTLDFILQELNREINTIASKSSDIEISRWVIEAKSELEKIREQIQNIE